jgi:hypothetical protein
MILHGEYFFVNVHVCIQKIEKENHPHLNQMLFEAHVLWLIKSFSCNFVDYESTRLLDYAGAVY